MTNATTIENNGTSHEQIKGPCNQTANSDKEQNCVVNTLQTQNNHCSNNTNNNATTTDCETIITATENNSTINTIDNQVVDKNTVLKYVYKKGDKAEIPIKDKGHFRNSLRRKRSTKEIHDKSPLPSKFQKPVIVNYETVHGSGEALAPLKNTGNNILGANLADFNIETLHLNPDVKRDEKVASNNKKDSSEVDDLNDTSNERGEKYNEGNSNSNSESEESSERGHYKNGKPQHRNENSDERGDYRNRKLSREDQDSGERGNYKTSKSTNNGDDSGEREDFRNKKPVRENNDSSEQVNYKDSQSKEDISDERGAYKNSDSSQERGESEESDAYKINKASRGHDDGSERGDYKSKKNGPGDNSNSAESNENNPRTNSRYTSQNKNSNENSESDESGKPAPNSSESNESIETVNRNKKTHDAVQEHRKIETYPRKDLDSSSESSNEGNESIDRRRESQNKYNSKTHINNNSPAPIRDIDLGDFNYERVYVNKAGKVEPQKDNLELADPNSAVEILPLSTAVPVLEIKNHETALASPEVESNSNKLIHIDDGEVKPVVEINPENDINEENSKSNASDEVESLESILGVKKPENFEENDQNDKIVEEKEDQNVDVKQEFERIPVNYNHAKKTENKDNPATETPKGDTEVTQKDGTLDIFTPEDVKYDEHLNIKFDDLAIKLPDIKLPDDILAYTRDSSPYSYDEGKKQKQADVPTYNPSYYYKQDDKKNSEGRNYKQDDDDSDGEDDDRAPDTGYYGYYGDDSEKKQNYKKKNAEADEEESDEDEDLYEKFVRERFGKRGTFEKRSEKLEAASPTNPELYKTIKHILKKTADIDEQAKKSGDPNAGYMWTLEYGEKL